MQPTEPAAAPIENECGLLAVASSGERLSIRAVLDALGFFLLVEVIGLAAVPLAALAFGRLPGAGLGFAKPLGLLLVTWLVWMAASVTPLSYGTTTVLVGVALLAVAGGLAAARQRTLASRLSRTGEGWFARRRAEWIGARALPVEDPARVRLWLGSEIVFAVAFAAMALLVAYSPDVWGTEKPMDMAFVNASNASTSFPPHDPWMSGEDLNYYYLGHLAMAIVIKVVGTAPDEGYNLAFALLAALSATAVFTFAGTLWAAARPRLAGVRGGPVLVGATAVVVCIVLGNLAGAREWLEAADPPGNYDWFAPSRVIPGTINEFPWFSFLLGDLHAHVLALPFTVVALAFAMQVALGGPRGDAVLRGVAEALAAGLAVGVLYAINSWSYPLTAGVLVGAVVIWLRDPASRERRGYAISWLVLVLAASVVLVLPFWLNFDPAASGLALVEERRPFTRLMGDLALLYGIFAGLLVAAFAARVLAARRPARAFVWGLVGLIFAGSLLAAADLAGVAVLAALLAVALGAALSRTLAAPERFLWLLVSGGLACVIAPELVYVRDAFDGSDLFRMNTVFKLGYQAWLLLALAAACALPWSAAHLPRRAWPVWAAGAAILLLLGLVYPYAGTYARKSGFTRSPSLDGLAWLRPTAPGDPPAIEWLRANTPGSAVVLEAVGEDYSAFGHARISTFSGRATVLGWAGHELQWDHEPGSRQEDVRRLYTTDDLAEARRLIADYGVDYVVFGPIERTTYGDAGLAKWQDLGEPVFERDGTTIWRIT
jgi:YYY domain-containing protein